MTHCPGCGGYETYESPCPGVTCPACVEKDADIARMVTIAGDALGTDPSLHTTACVEALANHVEFLRGSVGREMALHGVIDTLRAEIARLTRDVDLAEDRVERLGETLDDQRNSSNAEIASLRAQLAEVTAERDVVKSWCREIYETVGGVGAFDGIMVRNKILKLFADSDTFRTALRQCNVCVAFTKLIMDRMIEEDFGPLLDGADIQELAVEAGVLIETKYDPKVHGEQEDVEPGDPWYVLSDAYTTAIKETP